jgi:ribose/xylose/arabinose/galactoside ABC-type transport system permease subunit
VKLALDKKKLLVVVAGFVVATVIPLVLGVDFGSSLLIGAAFGVLFLVLCIPPFPATLVMTVLPLLVMVLFIPSDPPASDLPLHGWEFAWGASAIGTVLILAWHGLDKLRNRSRKGGRR